MNREVAILKRLGPVPFWRGERKCLDTLGDAYRRAMDAADAVLSRTPGTKADEGVKRLQRSSQVDEYRRRK